MDFPLKTGTYEPHELSNVKFKSYHYSFDDGYCVKFGITADSQIYILRIWKFSDDEYLNKALDEHVVTVRVEE